MSLATVQTADGTRTPLPLLLNYQWEKARGYMPAPKLVFDEQVMGLTAVGPGGDPMHFTTTRTLLITSCATEDVLDGYDNCEPND